MRSYASTGKGYTGADYRKGLPKGVPNREGDLFIDAENGRAYRAIRGPRGDLRLVDVGNQLLTPLGSWEGTYRMQRVMVGQALRVGAREWKVIEVKDDTIKYTDEDGQPGEGKASDLAQTIEAERKAFIRADEERKRTKSQRRDTVKMALDDARVEYVALAYDVNEKRGGIVVKGIENRDALPKTLVVLADQADGVIVGLRSEIEQTVGVEMEQDLVDAGVPDLAGDEALTEEELNATVIGPLNARPEPISVKPDKGLASEPKRTRIEISTLISTSHHSEFNDITIPDGWDFVSVDYHTFTDGDAEYVRDVRHIRYITVQRVVSE